MGVLYASLFYFIVVTTFLSGALGFLLKLPAFYRPDAYLIGADLAVGRGDTPFEILATYVFGLIYVLPLFGMVYAHASGSAVAIRAAAMMPLLYHVASVFGVLSVFPRALNPIVAPLSMAAGSHAFYAALCGLLMWAAEDAARKG
jgi:hypothetical protein